MVTRIVFRHLTGVDDHPPKVEIALFLPENSLRRAKASIEDVEQAVRRLLAKYKGVQVSLEAAHSPASAVSVPDVDPLEALLATASSSMDLALLDYRCDATLDI